MSDTDLTVSEFKKELEKLEELGLGDYIVAVGYDSNFAYTSVTRDDISIDNIKEIVFFNERADW